MVFFEINRFFNQYFVEIIYKISGFTGKNVRRGRITNIEGLDPSGPLFDTKNPAERLDRKDADRVEVVHTYINPLVGYVEPIGHIDFYPNYGIG